VIIPASVISPALSRAASCAMDPARG